MDWDRSSGSRDFPKLLKRFMDGPFDFAADVPFSVGDYWRQIVELYPETRFVLTTREPALLTGSVMRQCNNSPDSLQMYESIYRPANAVFSYQTVYNHYCNRNLEIIRDCPNLELLNLEHITDKMLRRVAAHCGFKWMKGLYPHKNEFKQN